MSDHTMSNPAPGEPMVARDPDEVLPARRRRRLRPLTAALAVVVLVGAGFVGGIQIQKRYGGSGSSGSGSLAAARSAFASRFGAGRSGSGSGGGGSFFGGGGGGGGGFGSSGGTQEVGQVSVIKGSTLYVADFLGNTVKVVIPAGARVTESKQLTVRGIHPGDTVTAQVTKLRNGNYQATSVTVTPASGSGT